MIGLQQETAPSRFQIPSTGGRQNTPNTPNTLCWVCLGLVCAFNSTVTLQGARITSNTSYITLNIKKCNSTLYTNCISDGELQQLQATSGGKFQALLMLMSNTISPESQEYHHPYIDSRRMFSFTLNNGLEADIYIQESVVQTDHSLTPVPDIQE